MLLPPLYFVLLYMKCLLPDMGGYPAPPAFRFASAGGGLLTFCPPGP